MGVSLLIVAISLYDPDGAHKTGIERIAFILQRLRKSQIFLAAACPLSMTVVGSLEVKPASLCTSNTARTSGLAAKSVLTVANELI